MSQLALVLSAGGARGAYEAGVVYYLRTGLPKKYREKAFQIYSGTSVGAINTVGVASMAEDPKTQGERIKEIWFSISQENIYHRNFSAATHFLGSTLGGLIRNFLSINPFHLPNRKGPHMESFLNTAPLKDYLKKHIPWQQMEKNIRHGNVDAVSISVTNLTSGRSELFIDKKPHVPYKGHYIHHIGPIEVDQVAASAAIPIIFPPEKIGDIYYADGGLRLFTPMSPAIQLGADRLIVVGLRKRVKPLQPYMGIKRKNKTTPTIPEQMGRMLNGLFLDRIEFDIEQLGRINSIIETSEKIYGPDYLNKLNEQMKADKLKTDIAMRGLRKIRAIEIQPSEFINKIFIETFHNSKKVGFKFSAMEKLLVRILDLDPDSGSDLLSYLVFYQPYLRAIFDLGYEDAKKMKQEILDILEDD